MKLQRIKSPQQPFEANKTTSAVIIFMRSTQKLSDLYNCVRSTPTISFYSRTRRQACLTFPTLYFLQLKTQVLFVIKLIFVGYFQKDVIDTFLRAEATICADHNSPWPATQSSDVSMALLRE
jgi:hypothetical protein